MPGKCLVVLWNREHQVSGFILESGNDGMVRLIASAQGNPVSSFVEQLAEVHGRLRSHKVDAAVAGGAMPEAIWLELTLPPTPLHELGSALEFELSRQLPRALDELEWSFRLLDTTAQRCRVRVFACEKIRWQDLLNSLREAGILCDAYCHTFMAVEATHDHRTLFLPDQQPEVAWYRIEGDPVGLRELRLAVDNDFPVTEQPEMLIAEYALSVRFQRDSRYLSSLPAAMRPQRLRSLKFAAAALGILVLLLLGAWWYRCHDDRQARENALVQELADIEYAMIDQQQGIEALLTTGESAQKLLEAVDEIDPSDVMASLSENLPAHAWVTSFRAGGNKVALSLTVKGETDSIIEALNKKIRAMTVESLRQQLNNDGFTNMTVTLQKSVEVTP